VARYAVRYREAVLEDDLPEIPANLFDRIERGIVARLSTHPDRYGAPLRHPLRPLWKIRVGDYRVAYEIDAEARTVTVWAIRQRRDIYAVLERRWGRR
jgi:mRNA interferase RelE/StbE